VPSPRGTLFALAAVALGGCGPSTGQAPAAAAEPAAQGAITALAAMTVPRAVHTSTLLRDGRVLVAGGFDNAGNNLASTELFDPTAQRFLAGARMQTARVDHSATLLDDGRVVIVGGLGDAGQTAEIYDPRADRFQSAGRPLAARNGHRAVRLLDGRVLVVGGDVDGNSFLATAEIFDPATGRFTPTGSMAVPRSSHTATLLSDGKVLVTGGHLGRQGTLQIHASAEIYDPATGAFAATGSMTRVRRKHDAVRLRDGRVLIVGGTDASDDRGAYDSVEVYDPATGRFVSAGRMAFARYKIQWTTVPLLTAQVLVAGGADQAELYEPAAATFAAVPGNFGDSPLFAAATLLLDGRVLITGGYGLHSYARPAAWIYTP
jgi:hypothetical protein